MHVSKTSIINRAWQRSSISSCAQTKHTTKHYFYFFLFLFKTCSSQVSLMFVLLSQWAVVMAKEVRQARCSSSIRRYSTDGRLRGRPEFLVPYNSIRQQAAPLRGWDGAACLLANDKPLKSAEAHGALRRAPFTSRWPPNEITCWPQGHQSRWRCRQCHGLPISRASSRGMKAHLKKETSCVTWINLNCCWRRGEILFVDEANRRTLFANCLGFGLAKRKSSGFHRLLILRSRYCGKWVIDFFFKQKNSGEFKLRVSSKKNKTKN